MCRWWQLASLLHWLQDALLTMLYILSKKKKDIGRSPVAWSSYNYRFMIPVLASLLWFKCKLLVRCVNLLWFAWNYHSLTRASCVQEPNSDPDTTGTVGHCGCWLISGISREDHISLKGFSQCHLRWWIHSFPCSKIGWLFSAVKGDPSHWQTLHSCSLKLARKANTTGSLAVTEQGILSSQEASCKDSWQKIIRWVRGSEQRA